MEAFTSLTSLRSPSLQASASAGSKALPLVDKADFKTGGSSLRMVYRLAAGTGAYAEVFRNHFPQAQDWSFHPHGISVWVKGTKGSSEVLRFLIYDGMNKDHVLQNPMGKAWYADDPVALSAGKWTQLTVPFSSFRPLEGGKGRLRLNRVGGWALRVLSTSPSPVARDVRFDDLRLLTDASPSRPNHAILSGSMLQIWNDAGCKCGNWTQERWNEEAVKIKTLCQDTIYLQYGVWSGAKGTQCVAWYPSRLSWVTDAHPTMDRIFNAAKAVGLKVVVGLYFNENWNTADPAQASTYRALLDRNLQVIDELWGRYGTNPAFGGWYIPQEIEDLHWQSEEPRSLLADWVERVAAACKAKSPGLQVVIAPYFGLIQPADAYQTWWTEFLSKTPSLDAVLLQDGVGTTRTTLEVDVPPYFQALKNACQSQGKTFGAVVESFHQTHGWPLDDQPFASVPADIASLKSQLWMEGGFTRRLVQYEWDNMEDSNGAAAALYQGYAAYQKAVAPCP